MRLMKKALLIIMSLLAGKNLTAQHYTGNLTPLIKSQIIENVSSSLISNYVYPDTALKMADHIKQRLKNGAYTFVTDHQKFAKLVTADLLTVFNDGHLLVRYSPQKKTDDSLSYIERAVKQIKFARSINAGVMKAEILTGNVGYIKLDIFSPLGDETRETINNAISFIRNSDALIIDLRHNGGGNASMVSYLTGFFFDKKTRTTGFYNRNAHQMIESWAEPNKYSDILSSIPIYILTSNYTGSCAELFTYDLQTLGRATVVGERTKGAANPMSSASLGDEFEMQIPYARAINYITKTSWEGVGVLPNVKAPADKAIDAALLTYFNDRSSTSKNEEDIKHAKWLSYIIRVRAKPVKIPSAILKKYVGNYSNNIKITHEGDNLYVLDGYKQLLTPISNNQFVYYSSTIEFVESAKPRATELILTTDDGKIQRYIKQ